MCTLMVGPGTLQRFALPRRPVRLRATILLVCLLLGPFQLIAATLMPEADACCKTGVCPMHAHPGKTPSSHPGCNHTGQVEFSTCSLECGGRSHDQGEPSLSLPLIVLGSSMLGVLLSETRNGYLIERPSLTSLFPSPPDKPPRR